MEFSHGHALLVGVGTYKSDYLSAPITERDARAVDEALRTPTTAGYPSAQVTVLSGPDASAKRILQALDTLRGSTDSDSTVLLFLSGHGVAAPGGGYYFLSHDAQRTQGSTFDPSTVVSSQQLLDAVKALPARKVLVLFNTCHAGLVAGSLDPTSVADPSVSPPPDDLLDALLAEGEGRAVISACRGNQKSWYKSAADLTIFTEALIDGLKGAQGIPNRQGHISLADLYDFLSTTVPGKVQQLGNEVQEPVLTIREQVGPFRVALYQGGQNLGADGQASEPSGSGVRRITAQQAEAARDRLITIMQADRGGIAAGQIGNLQTGSGQQFNFNGPVTNEGRAYYGGTHNDQQYGGVRFGDNAVVNGQVAGGNIVNQAASDLDPQTRQQIKDMLDQLADLVDNTRELPRATRSVVITETEAAKQQVDQPEPGSNLAQHLQRVTQTLKVAGEGIAAAAPIYALVKTIAGLAGIALP